MPFPDRLRAWRADMGLTREQAAVELGIKLKTLEAWEQGKYTKRIEEIIDLHNRLIGDGF
ncbi:hypothetical protein AW736_26285 [Termitidicoccus mucosus]|uniref:HTH cro/C1-type domain-containing protein n=1 Tax=Termitidicoccus mucosus TaxID=1184151 RepID=A0A178IQ72_9BACT|nr:hypothetical protein AW736_26285 [Opitutaceae bacterium TSB47]